MIKTLSKYVLFIAMALAFASTTNAAVFIVPQGGTGQSTLPSGGLLVGNGVNAITSTSSPVVGVVTATSTVATSTFANGINLTKGCFAVNGVCISSGSSISPDWLLRNGAITPTTTVGILVNASSTIFALQVENGTTTNATTTALKTTNFTIGTLSGFLKAASGVVSTALVSLSADVSGDLPFANLTQIGANSLLGNNTSAGADVAGIATSTLYGVCTGGQVVGWSNALSGLACIATSSVAVGGSSFGQVFEMFGSGGWVAPTSTIGAIISASSTIGSGTQAGGLTISGGATTTGFIIVQGTATSTFAAGIQATALNITGATSTFANGIQLASGCYRLPDGTCAGAGAGSGTVGTGTAGQVPFYEANGTTLTATSTLFILQTGVTGKIGIGTTTPLGKLSVNPVAGENVGFAVGSSTLSQFIVMNGSCGKTCIGINTASPAVPLDIWETAAAAQLRLSKSAALYAQYTVDSAGDLQETTAGGDFFNFFENRWICTGGSCPALTATSTSGNVFVEEAVTFGNGFSFLDVSASILGMYNAAGNLLLEFTGTALNAVQKLGVSTTTPTGNFSVEQGTETYSVWHGNQGSTTPSLVVMGVNGNGAVGFGTSTPQAQVALGYGAFYVPQYDVSTTTGVTQIYPKNGNDQRMRYGNSALNVNINQAPAGFKLILELCGPSAGTGGAITLTGSSTLLWKGGTAWTQTTTANKCDTVTFRFTNASSTPVIEAIAATNF